MTKTQLEDSLKAKQAEITNLREAHRKLQEELRASSNEMFKLRREREQTAMTVAAVGKLLQITYGEI
jgi:peptidoglycan hydrolase CwlO-like protein